MTSHCCCWCCWHGPQKRWVWLFLTLLNLYFYLCVIMDLSSDSDFTWLRLSNLVLIVYKDKEFSLWAEMRQQDACYGIHLFGTTLHLCWSFSVNRTCRRNTDSPKSLGLGLSKKTDLFPVLHSLGCGPAKHKCIKGLLLSRGHNSTSLVPVDTAVYRTCEIKTQDVRFVLSGLKSAIKMQITI